MTNMKVIWQNNKSVESGRKNNIELNQNCLNKPSYNTLTKMKGYNHRLNNTAMQGRGQIPKQGVASPVNEKEVPPPQPSQVSQPDGDGEMSVCRVCGRSDSLRSVDGCEALLYDCFHIQVSDLSIKICKQCVELIAHTQQFKEMICAAFHNPSDVTPESVKSFESITKPKIENASGSEKSFVKKIHLKEKHRLREKPLLNKKAHVICMICGQKYSMMNHIGEFVCCRCKVKSDSNRTVSCVTCNAIVPYNLIKEHLERHTKTDLKGRCRLRSLTKQPSKAQTDCDSRKRQKQGKLQCRRCEKQFTLNQRLEQHMRVEHGEFCNFVCRVCGKDMRSAAYLEKHMKSHARSITYECQFCGRIFKNRDVMEKHSASVHGDRLKVTSK